MSAVQAAANTAQAESTSALSSFFGDLVSSIFPTVHAEEDSEDESEESKGGDEGGAEEEEEEDEPEDIAPAIYEECENSKACSAAKHHFEECQERVQEGKGFKDENCIEEFFHLAHCAQECTAPKLFSKLV